MTKNLSNAILDSCNCDGLTRSSAGGCIHEQAADALDTKDAALKEAERFMAYFADETGGSFAGPGTPAKCLEQIRAALRGDS